MVDLTSGLSSLKIGIDYALIVTIGKIMSYAFLIVVCLVALWFFVLRPMTYKVRVVILSRRSGGMPSYSFDRGKFIKQKGIVKFVLLKKSGIGSLLGYKWTMPPPDYDLLTIDDRGQSVLTLEKFGEYDYKPLKVSDTYSNSPFHTVDSDVKYWMTLEMKQAAQKYAKMKFFDKYGGFIMFMIGMVLCIVILWMTLGKVSELSGALANAGDKMAQAVSDLGKQILSAQGG
jgi:hypothetical protein